MRLRFSAIEVSRWLVLAALVFAPWAFGSTRPWTKDLLAWGLLATTLMFVFGLVHQKRWPRVPLAAAGLSVALLLQGWWMVSNAWQKFDEPSFTFSLVPQIVNGWPGAVDQAWSARAMLMITGLLGVLWVVCDLASRPEWRMRLTLTMALCGAGIVVLGLLQHATGANEIFWANANRKGGTFFATYRYHANAGAFINVIFPFVALFAISAFRNQTRGRAFWGLALLLTATASLVNTSRAAMSVTALLLIALAVWQIAAWRQKSGMRTVLAWSVPIAAIGTIIVLGWAFGLDRSFQKWMRGGVDGLLENQRLIVYETIWSRVVPGAGNWGFGPGTFQPVFPFYTHEVVDKIPGIWRYAHQDYLQTLVEWGWFGAGAWTLLIFGGLGLAIWRLIKSGSSMSFETRSLLVVSILSLAGILIHAMADFPLQIASLRLYAVCVLGICWTVGALPRRTRRSLTGSGYSIDAPDPGSRDDVSGGGNSSIATTAAAVVASLLLLSGCAPGTDPSLSAARAQLTAKQEQAARSHAKNEAEKRQAALDRALLEQQIEAALPNLNEGPDVVPIVPLEPAPNR